LKRCARHSNLICYHPSDRSDRGSSSDPIAHGAAVARSAGQGVGQFSGCASHRRDVRPENASRRRSLALERSEHDGKLMAYRNGGFRAVLSSIMIMRMRCGLRAAADATAESPLLRRA
jgi:hypothetical protein